MKVKSFLYKKVDYIGFAVFVLGLVSLLTLRIMYPHFKELFNTITVFLVYISLIFFCFCNVIIIKPWKEYLWSTLFALGIVASIILTGTIETTLLFSLGTVGALIICISDYVSQDYHGIFPKNRSQT